MAPVRDENAEIDENVPKLICQMDNHLGMRQLLFCCYLCSCMSVISCIGLAMLNELLLIDVRNDTVSINVYSVIVSVTTALSETCTSSR